MAWSWVGCPLLLFDSSPCSGKRTPSTGTSFSDAFFFVAIDPGDTSVASLVKVPKYCWFWGPGMDLPSGEVSFIPSYSASVLVPEGLDGMVFVAPKMSWPVAVSLWSISGVPACVGSLSWLSAWESVSGCSAVAASMFAWSSDTTLFSGYWSRMVLVSWRLLGLAPEFWVSFSMFSGWPVGAVAKAVL